MPHPPDNTHAPLVSVVIPFHRGAVELKQACLSVQRQSFTRWEALLVNDHAPAACRAIAAALAATDPRFRVLDVQEPHSPGPWLARNIGICAARGHWVAFLDADDLWHPDKLLQQLTLHHKGVQISACTYDRFVVWQGQPRLIERRSPPSQLSFRRLLWGNVIPLSATMLPRDLLLAERPDDQPTTGPFLQEAHEDYGLWLRIMASNPGIRWGSLAEPLMAYRLHPMAISNNRVRSIIAVNQLLTPYARPLKRLCLLVIWAIDRVFTALSARIRARLAGRLSPPVVALLNQV